MTIKSARFLLALALGLVVATGQVSADENESTVLMKTLNFTGGDGSYKRAVEQGIKLGTSSDAPYSFKNEATGEYDGVDARIVQEALKRMGVSNVSWTVVPFDSLIAGLTAKHWDLVVVDLHVNAKRLEVISFTSPAYWYGSGLAVQKGNPKSIQTWEDLSGKVVGAIRGSFTHSMLEKRTDLAELKLYTSNEAEFSDLIAGRVDAVVEDDLKINLYLRAHPDAGMEMATGYMPQSEELGYARFGVRKEDVDLNHALSRAIDEMRGDGTLRGILAEFNFTDRNLWSYPTK